DRYAAGETSMAWLDQTIVLHVPSGTLRVALQFLISRIQNDLRKGRLPLGHVKFQIKTNSRVFKVSITSLDEAINGVMIPELAEETAELIINARVQSSADELRTLVQKVLDATMAHTHVDYRTVFLDSFHPGYPHPTHRMS
ncbi:MAG TPA: hypothetical protein VGK87_11050, partial [Anaerolineae bacterium]